MTEEHLSREIAMEEAGLGQGLWRAVVEQLAQEMPEQQFNTWIKPLTAVVADDLSKVTLHVANRFKLDWIRAQYAGRLSAMLEETYGQPVALELIIAQREAAARTVVRPMRGAAQGAGEQHRPNKRRRELPADPNASLHPEFNWPVHLRLSGRSRWPALVARRHQRRIPRADTVTI